MFYNTLYMCNYKKVFDFADSPRPGRDLSETGFEIGRRDSCSSVNREAARHLSDLCWSHVPVL